jgi:hypothetical protein
MLNFKHGFLKSYSCRLRKLKFILQQHSLSGIYLTFIKPIIEYSYDCGMIELSGGKCKRNG